MYNLTQRKHTDITEIQKATEPRTQNFGVIERIYKLNYLQFVNGFYTIIPRSRG